MKNKIKQLKPFLKPFLCVFVIYIVAFSSVLRGGVSFSDDIERAVFGHAWANDFNRYSSTFLGYFLNTNNTLFDISPWSQIVAFGIMSIVSVIFTYILCDKKIKYIPLILSIFIGINPFIIECWLYKFDAPCMALSILVSMLPFLFWPHRTDKKTLISYALISLACLLIMLTSYQASSGIFIIMCLIMSLKELINKKPLRYIGIKIGFSALIYLVACLVFRFCLPSFDGYRPTEILPIGNLFLGILHNISEYAQFIYQNLTIVWKVLLLMIFIMFICACLINKTSKMKTVFYALLFLVFSFIGSLGIYIVLLDMPLNGRTFIGLGMILPTIIIYIVNTTHSDIVRYISILSSLTLLYSVCVFCIILGNGLVDQKEYGDFRNELLIQDLSSLYIDNPKLSEYSIQIRGGIGYSGVMRHSIDKFAIIKNIDTMQQVGLSESQYGIARLRFYYQIRQRIVGVWEEQYDCTDMETLYDGPYHSIKTNNIDKICIKVKD